MVQQGLLLGVPDLIHRAQASVHSSTRRLQAVPEDLRIVILLARAVADALRRPCTFLIGRADDVQVDVVRRHGDRQTSTDAGTQPVTVVTSNINGVRAYVDASDPHDLVLTGRLLLSTNQVTNLDLLHTLEAKRVGLHGDGAGHVGQRRSVDGIVQLQPNVTEFPLPPVELRVVSGLLLHGTRKCHERRVTIREPHEDSLTPVCGTLKSRNSVRAAKRPTKVTSALKALNSHWLLPTLES